MQSTTSSTRTFITPPAAEKVPSPTPSQIRRVFRRKNLPWLVVALLVVTCVFLLWQYHQAQVKLNVGSQQYYADMTKRLGKLIILPTNQTPTIVTVKNANAVRSQEFYASAMNGDVTFVYPSIHKAILYRPSANIIVNVAPVSVAPTTPATTK